ncbi:MAG TPA: AAA family ATPase [Myxococcota bacterium]|nr:AAA family ATPase [Myxococcota bacterium]
MRIAVAGTHFSGKTTLVRALSERLPEHDAVDEPYLALFHGGYAMSDPPTLDDYAEQLATVSMLIEEYGENAVFDRSPLDFLAYALSIQTGDFDLAQWREDCEPLMAELDLIVYCPIETPDRITVPLGESRKFRRRVDEKLRSLLVEDTLDLVGDLTVIEVSGTLEQRVEQVLTALAALPGPRPRPDIEL